MPGFIEFDPRKGNPAKIDYSLPLPGQITGKRIVQLDLALDRATDFLPTAINVGQSYAEAAGITKNGGNVTVDPEKAKNFLRAKLLEMGHNSVLVEESLSVLPQLLRGDTESESVKNVFRKRNLGATTDELGREVIDPGDFIVPPKPFPRPPVGPDIGLPIDYVEKFANKAINGEVPVPTTDPAGNGTTDEPPANETAEPNLFLIEVYGISSFLGDYGIGKTVRTFTLLPGESTTIKLKTWQSTKESIKESSSIIDSHEQSAKERFSKKVQDETTDKQTSEKSKKWAVEAKAKASWGWGSASVKANAEGEYHSGREQFAKAATESVGEHSKEASSKRELSITSSVETETELGEETTVERVINNVNMRRVLNFVFRELNQKYITKLHLLDIHIAYTNGFENTWREVPISGLRTLLSEVLIPAKIDETAQQILKVAGTVFDEAYEPVRVLEKISYDPVSDVVQKADASIDAAGQYAPPTDTTYYRFKRGPLKQDGMENQVNGVLLSNQEIVMRTDSVIAEALLGESDALDNYSMEIQEAAAKKETIANERALLLHDTLLEIADPEKRAELAAALFSEPKTTENQS